MQLVNVGYSANDGTGSSLRDAFILLNQNLEYMQEAMDTFTPGEMTTGPWIDARAYATLALADAAAVAAGKLLLVATAWVVDTLTLSSEVKALPGAMLTVNSGQTLTVSGSFEAGMYQVFDGAGAVTLSGRAGYVQWFGASGDGATNDTAAFTAAAAASKTVMVPYSADGYVVNSDVVNSDSTFIFMGAASQIAGTATPAQLRALFTNGGYVGGVPIADGLRSEKIEIVAGTIVQDAVDKTKWNFISNGTHTSVGVSGDYATAAGSTITINFAKTYSKVISFVAGPDEGFANGLGMSVGATVGLSTAGVKASLSLTGDALIRWDGAAWVSSVGSGQDLNFTPTFEDDAYGHDSVVVSHDYCPGIGVQVFPWMNAGAVNFTPVIASVANTSTRVKFVDPAAGTVANAGVPDTKMAFKISKTYSQGILLDGSGDSSTLDLSGGNIWFFGIFQV